LSQIYNLCLCYHMRYLFYRCKDTPLCLTSPPVPTTFAGEPRNRRNAEQWERRNEDATPNGGLRNEHDHTDSVRRQKNGTELQKT
ncbi:MAG: hypothetical protein FWF09_08390, partial [Bacteroidales bacterium]|nr:hypothetical protein [Bacteroidales bacterium]